MDDWSAPSLVGQAIYGGWLIKLFSPEFLVLRLSTLLLSCCTAVLLWTSFRRIGLRRDIVCAVVLSWIFNPIQFNLAFTFMTEVPFLFFVALAVRLYILHLENGRTWPLLLSAVAVSYSFLIRQTGAFFVLALVGAVLSDSRKGFPERLRRATLIAGTGGAFFSGYYLWVAAHGGATAAVHRKFALLNQLTTEQVVGNSYGTLFYLAFMTLPLWLLLFPSLSDISRYLNKSIRIGALATWSIVVVAGLWWFGSHDTLSVYFPSTAYHARMPFLLNVLYDTGLGPVTLDPDYFGPSPLPFYPRVWLAVTTVVAIGAVMLTSFLTFCLARLRALRIFREHRPLFVFSGLAFAMIALFEVVFSHLQEGGLFDRHILTIAFPFYLLLGLFSCENEAENKKGKRKTFALCTAGIVLAALIVFCVAATHDYMEWNRLRWDMGRDLLQKGINPLVIAGGFEFNAWHNYDTFVARGNVAGIRKWWYDRRYYAITMRPIAGYEVLEKREYLSWVHHRRIALYLIRNSRL